LYVARSLDGAFVEVFLRNPGPYRSISLEAIDQRVLSVIEADRTLRLVDLVGLGQPRMGVDNRLATGSYTVAQKWSRAFHDHPDEPDGILYTSRHHPRQLLAAIYSRAADVLSTTPLGTLRQHLNEDEMYALFQRYGLGEL
ncbi:MAG: RES family NAD+ phosphorylase, partial [Gammaproteobacteria bacterium]